MSSFTRSDAPGAPTPEEGVREENAPGGGRPASDDAGARRRRATLVAGVAALLLAERFVLASRGIPAGYDESLYILRALRWFGDAPPYDVGAHMPGTSVLVAPLAAVDAGLGWYRALTGTLGVALVLLTYLFGRRFLGFAGAGVAALSMGFLSLHVFASQRILPDIPAAFFVMLTFLYYARRVAVGEGASGALWPIGLGLGVTFYLNPAYAAFNGLALGIDYLIRRRGRVQVLHVLLAAATFAAVAAAYFIRVRLDHGSPFHLIQAGFTNSASGRAHGSVAGNFGTWFFSSGSWFGPIVGAAVLIGAWLLVSSIRGRGPLPRADAITLGLLAAVPAVLMGVLIHSENRYMFVATPVIVLMAGLAAQTYLPRRPHYPAALVGVLAVVAVSGFGYAWVQVGRVIRNEGAIHRMGALVAERASRPCQVFSAYPTQMALSSRCMGYAYGQGSEVDFLRRADRFGGDTLFVWYEHGPRQPRWLPRFASGRVSRVLAVPTDTFLGRAEIYHVDSPGP